MLMCVVCLNFCACWFIAFRYDLMQGGDVIRLRHAEVEGQLAAFVPSTVSPTSRQTSAKLPMSPTQPTVSTAVSLLLNPDEEDQLGSSLSLWEVSILSF